MNTGIVVNPYLPSYEYVPDGEPYVFGDRLYLFGSHDRFGAKAFCENDYVCWSAPVDDLAAWRYEGVIYRRVQDRDGTGRSCMFAPDVARGRDGRYYLYYGMGFENRIGIAVCDAPAGRYEFYASVRYPDGTLYGGRAGEPLRFDPGVLADDDGRIWLYTGFSAGAAQARLMSRFMGTTIDGRGSSVVELAADMKTVISEPKRLLPGVENSRGTGFEGHEFYEASSIRKFDGKYYAIYSSVLSHELAYAVSDRPDGGFVFQGTLHSNADIGVNGRREASTFWGNNHGSVELVNGKYYIFGHRQTNGGETSRQGIAEVLEVGEDGGFQQAELTSQGLYGRPLPMEGTYEAAIACALRGKRGAKKTGIAGDARRTAPYFTQDGADRENNPGQYIANFSEGCTAGYKYFEAPDGAKTVTVRVRGHRGSTARGALLLSNDERFRGEVSAAMVDGRAGQKLRYTLRFGPGQQALWLRYVGHGSLDILTLEFD